MKTILSIVLSLSILLLKAQNYFTYGQVYDYDVGDILQTQDLISCGTPANTGPPTVTTMSVTGKILTSTKVVYTVFETSFSYTCFNCPPSYSTAYTYSLSYPILDTIPKKYYFGSGICGSGPFRSVTFYQTAGRPTEKLYFDVEPPPAFEPGSETDVYITGIGGPFFTHECRKDLSCHYKRTQRELLYCYKVNGGSYPLDLVVNNEFLIGQELVVYPVPSNNKVNVKSGLKIEYYSIMDVTGKVFLRGIMSDNSIDIESLKPGEYICAFLTDTHRTITVRILKE
jgi:hypothetical protein